MCALVDDVERRVVLLERVGEWVPAYAYRVRQRGVGGQALARLNLRARRSHWHWHMHAWSTSARVSERGVGGRWRGDFCTRRAGSDAARIRTHFERGAR